MAKKKKVIPLKRGSAIDVIIGNRIRARRLELHISQSKLADALGLTFQQVQKYEKGSNRVSASRLQQIADFLQSDIMNFMGDLAAGKKSPAVSQLAIFMATKDGVDIVEAMIAIANPSLRQTVIQIARSLGNIAEAKAP